LFIHKSISTVDIGWYLHSPVC